MEIKTINYETGRHYDFPQVLNIEVKGNIATFTDPSRKMTTPLKVRLTDRTLQIAAITGDETIGRAVLRAYDTGNYTTGW